MWALVVKRDPQPDELDQAAGKRAGRVDAADEVEPGEGDVRRVGEHPQVPQLDLLEGSGPCAQPLVEVRPLHGCDPGHPICPL